MIRFITAARISKEKGFNRVLKLCELLTKEGIEYEWKVYGQPKGNYGKDIINKAPEQLKFMGYKDNLTQETKQADYMVLLSDTEGFPYATYEALSLLTPCIVTDFPSAKEQITDGINGWILDMDLSNWKKILQKPIKLTKFVELSNEKDWINLIEQ